VLAGKVRGICHSHRSHRLQQLSPKAKGYTYERRAQFSDLNRHEPKNKRLANDIEIHVQVLILSGGL